MSAPPPPGSCPTLRLLLPDAVPGGMERLAGMIPGLRAAPLEIVIPLQELRAEEALALCLRCGVTCRGTRVEAAGAG